jgi:hypothetical protein
MRGRRPGRCRADARSPAACPARRTTGPVPWPAATGQPRPAPTVAAEVTGGRAVASHGRAAVSPPAGPPGTGRHPVRRALWRPRRRPPGGGRAGCARCRRDRSRGIAPTPCTPPLAVTTQSTTTRTGKIREPRWGPGRPGDGPLSVRGALPPSRALRASYRNSLRPPLTAEPPARNHRQPEATLGATWTNGPGSGCPYGCLRIPEASACSQRA